MDEDFEELLANQTLDHRFGGNYYHTFNIVVIFVASLIGITADIILIAAIVINKRIQTKINWFLLCFLILDICSQINAPSYFAPYTFYFREPNMLICLAHNIDMVFQFLQILYMFILMMDCIINSVHFTNRAIFYGFAGTVIGVTVLLPVCCMLSAMFELMAGIAILSILLLIIIVCKDIYRWFRTKTGTLSEEVKFRLNIARIYIYSRSFIILLILVVLWGPLGNVVFSIQCYISAFILLYIYKNDRLFKMCILNLFKRRENRYNVDVGFIEEHESQEDDEVDEVIGVVTAHDSNFTI